MDLGLANLIDPRLLPLVDDSRSFYEKRTAGGGPNGAEELRAMRAGATEPALASPPPEEELVTADGRSVPLRIHTPVNAAPKGVFLELHGGGFYMGSAAAATSPTAASPTPSTSRLSTWTIASPPNIPGRPLRTIARPPRFGLSRTHRTASSRRSSPSAGSRPARHLRRVGSGSHAPGHLPDLRRPVRPAAGPHGRRRPRHPASGQFGDGRSIIRRRGGCGSPCLP